MKIGITKSRGSRGATLLKRELQSRDVDVVFLKKKNSNYKGDRFVINWGGEDSRAALNSRTALASNKISSFEHFEHVGVPCVPATRSMQVALEWINSGAVVVCRTLTRASSGEGIVLASTPEELVRAPLYTMYTKKKDEYRVHVFSGEVIDVARKARDLSNENPDWKIRTHNNGFVYVRENVELPDVALDIAKQAVRAVGLQFGAVDMLYNEHYDSYSVLEVNSAPGITGTTVSRYADAIIAQAEKVFGTSAAISDARYNAYAELRDRRPRWVIPTIPARSNATTTLFDDVINQVETNGDE